MANPTWVSNVNAYRNKFSSNVNIDSVEKLLIHKNSAICFMSCTNIYEILNKFEELLKNKNN